MKIKNILYAFAFCFLFTLPSRAENNLILHYEFNDSQGSVVITDSSSKGNHGELKGVGAVLHNGKLTLPGGAAGSNAAYVELPQGVFDSQNTLTISVWLRNETGAGNYAAMFFGTQESLPSQYWLLNPANPSGKMKSVITNSVNTNSPWTTEYGFSPSTASQGIDGPATDTDWNLYTTIIQSGSITAYYNDVKVGVVSINRTVSQLGSNLVSYIGRSSYNDAFFKGDVMGLKVYNTVLSENKIKNRYKTEIFDVDYENLHIPTRLVGDIELPVEGEKGSTITWSSSDVASVTEKGKVTVSEQEKQILLTATVTFGSQVKVKSFLVTVVSQSSDEFFNNLYDNYDVGISYITDNIILPVEINGVTIVWSSNNAAITPLGVVTRPAIGAGDQPVKLTATFSKNGGVGKSKDFNVTVAEADYGYLLTYVLSGNTGRMDCFHLANSLTGGQFEVLNKGKAVKYPLIGAAKMGSPVIFRKPDGSFGLIASDDNNSANILIYDSEDLITYHNERLIQLVFSGNIKVKDPVCVYDNGIKAYRIYWQGSDEQYYESITTDLITASQPITTTDYTKSSVAGTVPLGAIESAVISLTKAEYNKVVTKYMNIANVGVEPIASIKIAQGGNFILPEKVNLLYNDESVKAMGVKWEQADINAVDVNTPETYTINGIIQQPAYGNPFIQQRADPWVIKGPDGYYYFTASYPMVGSADPEGYDRVILRRSETLEGLSRAQEITIWDEKNSNSSFRYIWAPELHYINGTWYVLFTSSNSSSNVWGIRPIMIACSQGDKDPFKPENWEKQGRYCEPFAGDNIAFNSFSLDMTYFESGGGHYVLWAEKPTTSNIMIASVDPNQPWKATSKSVLLTKPEYAWEWNVNDWVNEGPAVIKNNGKIYVAFSASSVNETYCVGFVYADDAVDLLKAESWTKLGYPVLESVDLINENGPGHNSFTVDEYGNPIIVYHARTPGEPGDRGLYDPGRHARVKSVNFAIDGTPVLNMTPEEELLPANKNVQIQIIVQ